MNRTLLFFVLTTVAGALSAQTAFEPLADKVRAQALSLPSETSLVSLTPADKDFPRQTYVIHRAFGADGSFTTEWKGARAELAQTFRADGTLLSGKQTDLAKGITVETRSDAGRTSVRTIITEKGSVKSDKTTALKPGIVLREELQHLNLQAWSYGVRDGLKFQSLSPDGGMVGDFQVTFRTTADPTKLSDKYTYPAEFKASLAGRATYVVADMNLLGVGAFFFPHHFYLVYVPEGSGLRFAAYFGEDPKAPVFQFVPR